MEIWCPNCHKRIVCTSGMCPSCYVPTVTSHTATVYPSPDRTEINALRAELARVKAESLRVVVDGEACDWEMLEDSDKDGLFVVDGKLYCRDRGTRNKIVDVSTGEAIHIYDEDGVQPVRLERWEHE